MSLFQTFSFSDSGYGSLELELDKNSKQIFSKMDEPITIKLEVLGEHPYSTINKLYFFEWQKIQYTYTIEADNKFTAPFQLRINNRIEKISRGPTNNVHLLTGQFFFTDEVGRTRIEIRDFNNVLIFGLETEVFPQKMDYKSDYQNMISEISSIIQNLAYDILKDTFHSSRPKASGHSTQNEWWNILNTLFDRMITNLSVIIRQPKHEIRSDQEVMPVERIKKGSKNNINWFQKNNQLSNKNGNGIRISNDCYFSHALSHSKYLTYDTYENRFVAWALRNIIIQLRNYRIYLEGNQGQKDYSPIIKKMSSYQRYLQGILHENPFNEVGDFEKRTHFSTSLTKGEGYRTFLYIYLLLTKGLELFQNEIFKIEQKNISLLYEYWCFLMLVKILKEQNSSEINYQDLIKIQAGKVKVDLIKGKQSKVSFKNKITDEITTLYYNKEFSKDNKKIFTYDQKPDYAIKFKKNRFSKPFWYLFDAKYRFDETVEKDLFNVPQDAIGQLHRYRDAILHSEPNDSTYRAAIKNLGGIILFPYPLDENKYEKENIYFQSIKDVNIGALPFLPSKTKLVTKLLLSLINKTPEEHFEKFIDMDRSEYYQQREKWKEWITIGVIPKENQSERIKFLRGKLIYYVPFVANNNSKLYMTKKLLVCKAGTKEAFQYDVCKWEILTDKELEFNGTTWLHNKEKYVAFYLNNEITITTPENITPTNFRYSTAEGLKRYLTDPNKDKWCFYLTNPDSARLYDELCNLEFKFEINWVNNPNDPSLIKFTIADNKVFSSDQFPPMTYILNKTSIGLHKLIEYLKNNSKFPVVIQ